MATRPEIRVGDADREATAASLNEHYAAGRLSLEEFRERLDAVFAATTQGDLDRITRDLPHVRIPAVPLPVTSNRGGPHGRQHSSSRSGDREHRGSRGSSRHQTGVLGGLAALLVSVLAIALLALTLVDLRIPWLPGRFSILLVGLMVIRSLLRRVFGACRR